MIDLMAKVHKGEYSLGGNTLIGRSGGGTRYLSRNTLVDFQNIVWIIW